MVQRGEKRSPPSPAAFFWIRAGTLYPLPVGTLVSADGSFSPQTHLVAIRPVSRSMQAIYCNLCALAVAAIFYGWREYHTRNDGRERVLRERVTYMLWVMANGARQA